MEGGKRVFRPPPKKSMYGGSLTNGVAVMDAIMDFYERRLASITMHEMVEFVISNMDKLKEQFIAKNQQYGDIDPLGDFRKGAYNRYDSADYNSMYKVALDYENKHVAHVYGHDAFGNKVDESLKDIAIYSLIELYLLSKAKQELNQAVEPCKE